MRSGPLGPADPVNTRLWGEARPQTAAETTGRGSGRGRRVGSSVGA